MKTIVLALIACALAAQVSESRWNYLPMRGQEFFGLVFTFENNPAPVTVDVWAEADGDPVHAQRTWKNTNRSHDHRSGCMEMNLGRDPLKFHVRRIAVIMDGHIWIYAEPLAGRFYGMLMP